MHIHYLRPPDRTQVFEQTLVHESAQGLVTFMAEAGVSSPAVVGDRTVLEPGAPVVWSTFPGAWHDIGRFHTCDGRFTGYYANILTPVRIRPGSAAGARTEAAPPGSEPDPEPSEIPPDRWDTTDLFLDVFLDLEGGVHLLDTEEFREAVNRGWIDSDTARAAETEAGRLAAGARRGTWPPAISRQWTLERARAAARARPD